MRFRAVRAEITVNHWLARRAELLAKRLEYKRFLARRRPIYERVDSALVGFVKAFPENAKRFGFEQTGGAHFSSSLFKITSSKKPRVSSTASETNAREESNPRGVAYLAEDSDGAPSVPVARW